MVCNRQRHANLHSTGYKLAKKIKKIKSSQALKPAGRVGPKVASVQALKRSSGLTFNMGYYKILNYEYKI
jgi:hypothetical protein